MFPEGCLPSYYILPTIGNSFRFAVKHHRQGLDEHSRDYLSSNGLNHLVRKIDKTGDFRRKSGSGQPRRTRIDVVSDQFVIWC